MPGLGRVPLIVDVDTGIDDALALLYACASPEADLVAVTCSSGNAPLEDTTRNTLAVLELAGRADVPVAAGRAVQGDVFAGGRCAVDGFVAWRFAVRDDLGVHAGMLHRSFWVGRQ